LSFSSLNLHESVQHALAAAGYTEPTPVQAEAIPPAVEGKDLIVSAQTGTGKTAAFMLPALSAIAEDPRKPGRGPRVLVLTPTRELAQQVTAAAQKYGSELKGLRTVSVLGGMPFPAQNRLLSRPYDILVATPGRLLDHMGRGRILFERLEMLVLDEADRMLDMGFIDDVEQIASACPSERQTLLFSATMDDRMAQLASNLLKEPQRIEIAGHTVKHEQIEQRVYYADDMEHKKKLLASLLNETENQAIVFAGTKVDSDLLADELAELGFTVDSLHGDMKQTSRNRTLSALRSGRTKVLVATDVAARGIDVPGISLVVNYDLPKNAEDYVHRIGRTGRAGRTGLACSLVGPRDRSVLRRIEQFTQQQLAVNTVEGLEPQRNFEDRRPKRFGEKSRWGHKDRQHRDDRNKRFGDRSDRPERSERFSREGRPERPERSDRFNREDRFNRDEQGSRPQAADRPFRGRPQGDRPQGDRPYSAPRSEQDDNYGNRATRRFNVERRGQADYDVQQPRINPDNFGEYQRRDFMERTGLQRKSSSRPQGAGGDRPFRQDGGFGGQRRNSNGGGDRFAPRDGNREFGGRGRSRDEGYAPRRFEDRPARSEGGYDNRPRRDSNKPPVRIEHKTRRSFDNSSARDDAGSH
jgi:superfamily II DNA/RNA helicase